MNTFRSVCLLAVAASIGGVTISSAGEGMWTPAQLPQMGTRLVEAGLEIAPEALSDLTRHPMNAVISLGGCTASFVSPDGLVVTNHHCAYRSIQYNSTEDRNLLETGFLARDRTAELFAGPGSRVLVTVAAEDVTQRVLRGLDDLEGYERYRAIEAKEKRLVAGCEKDTGHRCRVSSFHGGLQYVLMKQLEIRDVRLVYAPADGVGNYGGDVDNWMWPRHTGDFSFYRAYVGKDGKPADHDPENVPYRPQHFLKVASDGLEAGEFVMVAGYPGRTNRYRLSDEVENAFEWSYPQRGAAYQMWLDIIEAETADRPEAGIKYAGRVAGLNNSTKNYQGMLESYRKSDVVERKRELEGALTTWIAAEPDRQARYGKALEQLQELVAIKLAARERDLYYGFLARRSDLYTAARTLYRLSKERQKPDAEREPGYQERDVQRIGERMTRLDRTMVPEVDRACWRAILLAYAETDPAQHVGEFDGWFGFDGNTVDEALLDGKLDEMYAGTRLADGETRLELMDAKSSELEKSDDPFIRLAVAMYERDMQLERDENELSGRFEVARPLYMESLIAFRESQDKPVYPDANGTLRVTFGRVGGYSPRDGVFFEPFTSVRGILEKDTGVDPFDAPSKLLEAVAGRRYGTYADASGSVPVDFLSDVDTTGGNSGSPTLNSRGELVGLLFDGTYESIISDWDFLPEVTRSIHVDIRYALWVMEYVDNALVLVKEMNVGTAASANQ